MNLKHIALDDDLGVIRYCHGCDEWWPDDEEFFPPGPLTTRRQCIACRHLLHLAANRRHRESSREQERVSA